MDKAREIFIANKVAAFVAIAITIAVLLVSVSMAVYYQSDAYRLDLSRPEYVSKRAEISEDTKKSNNEFDSQGAVDANTVHDFLRMYDAEMEKIGHVKAFSQDVLSGTSLGIDDDKSSENSQE